MAKSIRSKWKRKMRAIKRERYGKKELVRLKKTLGIDDAQAGPSDVNMQDISEIVHVVSSQDIKTRKTIESDTDIVDAAEVDDIKKFNPKTLRNENGAYPIWLHPRKIKRVKKSKKKAKGKVTKQTKKRSVKSN